MVYPSVSEHPPFSTWLVNARFQTKVFHELNVNRRVCNDCVDKNPNQGTHKQSGHKPRAYLNSTKNFCPLVE